MTTTTEGPALTDTVEVPKPAAPLRRHGAELWVSTFQAYELSDHEQAVLLTACASLDDFWAATRLARREGMVSTNRYGSPVEHPACSIAARAHSRFLGALKQLGLPDLTGDDDDVPPPPRRHRRRDGTYTRPPRRGR